MHVLNRTPNQLYVEVLFDISENTAENVSLRTEAVSALRDPEYKDSTDRILLFLSAPSFRNYACGAVSAANALPTFRRTIRQAQDDEGTIYQYLLGLTNSTPRPAQSVEAWQKWFEAHPGVIPHQKRHEE